MQLNILREFSALANCGNYTKTASELFMATSTLSNHMKQLEDEIGFELIDKSASSFALTTEGCDFLSAVWSILDEYDSVIARCQRKSTDKTTLRIQSSKSYEVAKALNPTIMSISPEKADRVNLLPVGFDETLAVEAVKDGLVDIAFQDVIRNEGMHPPDCDDTNGGLRSFCISSFELVLLAKEGNPLTHHSPIDIQALEGKSIYYPVGSKSQRSFKLLRDFFARRGVRVTPRFYQIGSVNPYFFADAVAQIDCGEDIISFYSHLLPDELYDKKVLEIANEKIIVDYYAIYNPKSLSANQVSAIQAIQEQSTCPSF